MTNTMQKLVQHLRAGDVVVGVSAEARKRRRLTGFPWTIVVVNGPGQFLIRAHRHRLSEPAWLAVSDYVEVRKRREARALPRRFRLRRAGSPSEGAGAESLVRQTASMPSGERAYRIAHVVSAEAEAGGASVVWGRPQAESVILELLASKRYEVRPW